MNQKISSIFGKKYDFFENLDCSKWLKSACFDLYIYAFHGMKLTRQHFNVQLLKYIFKCTRLHVLNLWDNKHFWSLNSLTFLEMLWIRPYFWQLILLTYIIAIMPCKNYPLSLISTQFQWCILCNPKDGVHFTNIFSLQCSSTDLYCIGFIESITHFLLSRQGK